MRHVGLLKRLAVLKSAPTAEKPLRITGGLPQELQPGIPLVRIGPRAVVGGLPALPGTNIIYPGQFGLASPSPPLRPQEASAA